MEKQADVKRIELLVVDDHEEFLYFMTRVISTLGCTKASRYKK
jgi:hypothetical protein